MKHPGRAIEVQILDLVRQRQHFKAFSRILSPDFFAHPATRRIFIEITAFYAKHSVPEVRYVEILSILKIREQDEEVLAEAISVLGEMKRIHSSVQPAIVQGIAIDWAKRALIRQALYEGLEILDKGNGLDLDPVRSRLDIASTLGVEEEQDYKYLSEIRNRLTQESMIAPIEVGIPDIDEILQGGLDVGELGLFIGPTHRGKTRALVNVGVQGLRKGKHIAHVIVADSTVKRIARRYDSVLCNRIYSTIRDRPSILKNALREVYRSGSKLVIKEYDKISPTPNDVRHWLKEYVEKSERKIDLLILDYIDEMKCERSYKDYRHESKEVTASLRRLGAEFECPVWTASQGNRASMAKRRVDLDDVAEDINRANKADVVITLNQTDDEKEENIVRYHIAKARRENFKPKTFTLEISDAGLVGPVESWK